MIFLLIFYQEFFIFYGIISAILVIFKDVGAYTLAKAHTFNGINLPSVYSRNNLGEVVLEKEFTYQDYATKWRSTTSVPI